MPENQKQDNQTEDLNIDENLDQGKISLNDAFANPLIEKFPLDDGIADKDEYIEKL